MKALLSAILDDDKRRVTELLAAEPGLATERTRSAELYEGKILHWLYAGDTALHLAAAGHREQIVAALINAGADVNAAANHRHGRPLHYAADGHTAPNVDAASESAGVTPPAITDPVRQVKTILVLLQAGAELHAGDKNGATALHRAVRTRSAAAVACLLDAGADPTAKNLSGSTPFHLAVQNTGRGGSGSAAAIEAQRQIIREFLTRGVSPQLLDGHGKTVTDAIRSAWVREEFRLAPPGRNE